MSHDSFDNVNEGRNLSKTESRQTLQQQDAVPESFLLVQQQKTADGATTNETAKDLETNKASWIRTESEAGPMIKAIHSKQDVAHQISRAKKEQRTKVADVELHPRQWQPRSFSPPDKEHVGKLQRFNTTNKTCTFSVLQFNMLAQGLSAGPDEKPPFPVLDDDRYSRPDIQGYGGFSSLPFPKEALSFDVRRWRLLEVLLGGGLVDSFAERDNADAHVERGQDLISPYDIIAMEEMDRYHGFFAPLLQGFFGFDSLFAPKSRSPSARMGWYSDGCALFWNRKKFALVSERRVEYKVGNQVALFATIRHLETQQCVLVVVTHLKAQQSDANERIRVAQVEELMQQIQQQRQEVAAMLLQEQGLGEKERHGGEGDDRVNGMEMDKEEKIHALLPHVIIAGDFNAEPILDQSSAIAQVFLEQIGPNKSAFTSAYKLDDSGSYTTFKIRGPKTTKRIIDYIFYRQGSSCTLACDQILSIPDEEALEATKLPGMKYPSDHLAIGAVFSLQDLNDLDR